MATNLITQADLERRVGARTVAQFLSDDGGQAPDPTLVNEVLDEASRRAEGLLLPAFSLESVVKLALDDVAVRGDICDIAADLMSRRRPALLADDGTTPYSKWRKDAEEHLKLVAKNELRLAGERGPSGAGVNRAITIANKPNIDPPQFVFAGTKDRPGGTGGF